MNTETAGAAPTMPDMHAAMRAEQIRTLYLQQPLSLLGTVIVAILATVVLWNHVARMPLIAWASVVGLVTVIRIVNLLRFRRRRFAPDEMDAWARRGMIFAFVSGCTWAALPVMFINGGDPYTIVNIVVFCVGMAAGSLASQCMYLPVLFAFSLPVMIALPVSIHVSGGEFSYFAYLGYVFSLVLIGFARGANRVFRRSIEMRFENDRLVQELRVQKAEAEAANVAKSRFLAAASHDLRQPLHAAGLYAGALRDAAVTEEQEELNDKMVRAIDSLELLLGHILEISKLDAGVVQPKLRDFRISDLLERLDLRYRAIADQRGLVYRSECNGEIVRSDRLLLERVVDNLLANAVRFTCRGEIRLSVVEIDDSVDILIEDTGPGIPLAEQEKIFEEFYQIDNPERDRGKGLGLGLAVVRRLCRLLGHDLALDSAPGAGSRFRLRAPRGSAEYLRDAVSDESLFDWDLNERRILVIDDEREVRDATRAQLASWGCVVLTADSLDTALAATGMELPELLIVDYRLRNHESGIDTVVSYRDRFNAKIPAVLITGDTAPERLREAVDSGINVLHKPVTPAKLRMCVNQLTSRATRGGETSPP